MANEPLALAVEPEAPSEDDYRAFCAALSETARGRAFLAEYARRQRAAETAMLLAAVERLEGLVRSHSAPPAQPSGDAVRQELLALLDGIREMQAEIDAGGLTMQVAKLASLIEVVQQRIEAIVAPEIRHPEVRAERDSKDDGETTEQSAPSGATVDVAQTAVPEPAELPTPSPTVAQEPAVAPAAKSAAIPEVAWFDGAQPARPLQASAQPPVHGPAAALAIAAVVEAAATAASAAKPEAPKVTVFKAGTIPPPMPFAGEDFSSASRPVDTTPPADPLAAITALSEEERLALFT